MSVTGCQKCQQTQKRLKITISDYEFQIKKIQEDKSTDKVMYEIHLLKQVKRWQELYQKEKGQREDEGKGWMDKMDAMRDRYEREIKGVREGHAREMAERVEAMTEEAAERVEGLKYQYERKIKDIMEKSQKEISDLRSSSERKINEMTAQHESVVTNLKRSQKNVIDQKTRIFQSRLLGAQSQKLKEQKLHEQTKTQSKETQSKLYQTMFTLRKTITELQTKLAEQIKDSASKQEIIDTLKENIQKLKIQQLGELKCMKEESQRALEGYREDFRNRLAELYKENLDYCNKYQSAIERIEEKRESEKTIYLNNIQEINNFVQNRASRPEDIEEIDMLREALIKKTKQCDSLADELKFFRLELENKEQTYNKIFVPIANPSNEAILYKRKEFKLRRQGKSVTTVREALQSLNSMNNAVEKKFPPKMRII